MSKVAKLEGTYSALNRCLQHLVEMRIMTSLENAELFSDTFRTQLSDLLADTASNMKSIATKMKVELLEEKTVK